MKPICDVLLIANVVRGYSYVCGSNTKPARTVFAVERPGRSKTGENSMFASDLSARDMPFDYKRTRQPSSACTIGVYWLERRQVL
jgi:hypothetical protein